MKQKQLPCKRHNTRDKTPIFHLELALKRDAKHQPRYIEEGFPERGGREKMPFSDALQHSLPLPPLQPACEPGGEDTAPWTPPGAALGEKDAFLRMFCFPKSLKNQPSPLRAEGLDASEDYERGFSPLLLARLLPVSAPKEQLLGWQWGTSRVGLS